MGLSIRGKLNSAGLLTDIQARDVRTWADGSTDVVLLSWPVGDGPFGYDATTQLAIVFDPTIQSDNKRDYRILYLSATTLSVASGVSQGSSFIPFETAITITLTTDGTINGNDSFQGPGTVSTNNANSTITGTSTDFFTSYVPRLGTGTITSTNAIVNGTGTKFLSEILPGDLIGDSTTHGYYQVIAINSDTQLIISTSGIGFSSSVFNVIENPTIKIGSNTAVQVKTITGTTVLNIVANSSATVSGQNYRVGIPVAVSIQPATNRMLMYIWYGNGTSGVGYYVSTQRTLSYGITGYNTVTRKIGSWQLSAGLFRTTFDGLTQIRRGEEVWGFNLIYLSTTVVLVNPGECPDKNYTATFAMDIQASVTIATNGVINGNDSFQGPGTISSTNLSLTITGSSTTFLTSFGLRALTGTISSSAAVVTGTNTKFLTEVAIGDLIGNTTKGYFQIITIASDTGLTLVSTPGSAFSSATVNAIENPTINTPSGLITQVATITNDTNLTIASGNPGTGSGGIYRIGVPASTTTMPATNMHFIYTWAGVGINLVGANCFVSTQRTTPFGITGYNNYLRRIGNILLDTGNIVAFDQFGNSSERTYQYEMTAGASYLRALLGGTATAWTPIVFSGAVPPTAYAIQMSVGVLGSVGKIAYVRKRNTGDVTVARTSKVICNDATNGTSTMILSACDAAQCIDYAVSNSAAQLYVDIVGYKETLNR